MKKESILKRHPWMFHILIMIGISIVVLVLVFLFIKVYARQGKEYVLPDVVGTNIADLRTDNTLALDIVVLDSIFRPGEEGGQILTQDPKGGTTVKRGRKIYLTITAYNPEDAVFPELAGLTVRQAISELRGCGLEVGKLKFVEDPYKNTIIDHTCKGKTVYAGQQIERGSVIDLVVGLGDSTGSSVVPFVIGRTAEAARRDITAASLNVGKEHFRGVKNRNTAVVYRQEPDYTGVSRYDYGTDVDLWYIDADDTDIEKMISEFKVDSTKIIDPNDIDDGRPTPEEIESSDRWAW